MKIALIGYGKMGRLVEAAAHSRGHIISSIIDPKEVHSQITSNSVDGADLCIEFTTPQSALDNIRACASLGKSLIVGTTGWYEQLPQVKTLVEKAGIGLLYAPNFSTGVHLFMRLVKEAAAIINQFPQYDAALLEEHSSKKLDRPSGTALKLADILKQEIKRNPEICSLRCGSIPGTHTVYFDSPVDTITLAHTARSRQGFAEGAVAAAEWLKNKKGLFTLDDFLEDL